MTISTKGQYSQVKIPDVPRNEETRLKALESLQILDTPFSERFDRITRMASKIFQAPMVSVCLVDESRIWFKSSIGFDIQGAPRDISFSGHAILQDDVLVIPDTLKDDRFFDNPLVINTPFIRSYAACPIKMSNGSKIGTLCILDYKARSFDEIDITLLKDLASIVERELVTILAENKAAQFKSTMNASFDAIIVINEKSKVLDFNHTAETVFGYKHQEILGQNLLDLISPDRHLKAYKQIFKKFVTAGQRKFIAQRIEIEVVNRDAQEFTAEVSISKKPTLTEDYNSWVFVVFIRDLTERKLAAAQIIQSSKLATLGEMATSVAHELNQPLNVIRMVAWNIRRKISRGSADSEYLNQKLKRIEEQTARAASIIDHMRMFGREAKESPKPVNPVNVVLNALDFMGEQLRLADIEVVTDFAENCPFVLGHIIQMEQVILNLLTNAKDAMHEIDGEAKITLRVFNDDKGVHISAEDTGDGIPEEVLTRLFEPFFTTKEMGKGTGLGLSVSYGIVRDMNGNIVAENIAGGARFTITLPIVN